MRTLRDAAALGLCFAVALLFRASLTAWWPLDLFPGPEPVLAPVDPMRSAWMAAVILPIWLATGLATTTETEAPALPGWLVTGPVATALSLAAFELLRLEPVSRTLVVGFGVVATPVLGLLHRPVRADDPRPALGALAKRAVDIGLSAALLVGLAPLIGLFALRIRRDGGPAFFVQERVGWGGEPFSMIKLRTMTAQAEGQLAALRAHNQVDGPAFRMADDPRVTPFGRTLRTLGLDELPQLINVLRGEMSLVGPRPPLPSEVARYNEAQRARLAVPPGITGLWQLTGRELTDFDAWVALDRRYIDSWSLQQDLRLLLATLPWFLRRLSSP